MAQKKFTITYICPNCSSIHLRTSDSVQTVTMFVRELLDADCHTITIMDSGRYSEMLLDVSVIIPGVIDPTAGN